MKLDDDDFTLLGLPPRFAIDRAALDVNWRQRQAGAHPDRFAAEGAAAQRIAMQWAVRLNEAHRRLKDPLTRAAYLCELRGVPIDAERNTAMPASFLAQQMAWREALDEVSDAPAAERLDEEIEAAERALERDIAHRLDITGDATAAAADVRAWMFVRRFRADIQRRLDALDPAR